MTGTLEHLDPTTLQITDNVRDDAALDAAFLASVREHGVLQPITAIRATDGHVEVRDGQRRTLAARHAGLRAIPVYVLDGSAADIATRIAHQIVTNDQRTALTDAQRATGINQMLLAGVTAAKVAKALSCDRDTVTAASTAVASDAAMTALRDGQLSLTEAAALAEFDDDPTAVEALLRVAGGEKFAHRAAQLRQDRESHRARIQVETKYAAEGFAILEHRPEWRDTHRVSLSHLRTADGTAATDADVTQPVRWAVLLVEDVALRDVATGEPVDDAAVDWSTENQPDRPPADGTRHADTVVERTVWCPEYYCLDPQGCGLTLADFLTQGRPMGSDGTPTADGDDEARAEAQRVERRKVLVLNKLGLAAQQVRRTFVRDTLLSRKTALKGGTVFVASCLERGPGLLTEHAGRQLVPGFLGLGTKSTSAAIAGLTASGDNRAQVLLLGMVLAGLEGRTPKDAWRSAASRYAPAPGAAEYLRFLATHGYPLSDVEQVVTGDRTAEDVFATIAESD